MSPTAIPTRITIDFRDAVHPSRSWILGLDSDRDGRVELLAFEASDRLEMPGPAGRPAPTISLDCSCPEFCERDHANE